MFVCIPLLSSVPAMLVSVAVATLLGSYRGLDSIKATEGCEQFLINSVDFLMTILLGYIPGNVSLSFMEELLAAD